MYYEALIQIGFMNLSIIMKDSKPFGKTVAGWFQDADSIEINIYDNELKKIKQIIL